MGMEGGEDFLGVDLRDFVDVGELLGQGILGLFSQGTDPITKL